jgi:hypothetical protein
LSQQVERENVIGTIEHVCKMLAFLETLENPSAAAQALIRQYRAEVEAYFWDQRQVNAARRTVGLPEREG